MAYTELHCKTNFSFLEGASHAAELVERAAELEYAALAITDRNSLAGVVRAHGAAKDVGLKLLIGAEITPTDAPPIVLWATDRAAYGRLCRLITCGRRRAPKGECHLTFDDLAGHAEGLLAGVLPHNRFEFQISNFKFSVREVFGDRCYLLAELHRGLDDRGRLERLKQWSRESDIPLVAAGDVHYHSPARLPLQHVLTAIRHGTTVAEAGDLLLPNAQRHLKPVDELRNAFADAPEAIHRTREIADRCTFTLDELRYEYPEELAPHGQTPMQYLVELTWKGSRQRYPDGVPEKVKKVIRHELELIEELHYEAYFLTVWDLVRLARSRNILCQGRGSAANSAVCYCLGVTSVDPDRTDLLFERFVSRERDEAPDIDIDFEHERREEVLQYLYDKYGRERAGLAATVVTYCSRSAIRDVGKALGFSLDLVDALAKQVEGAKGVRNLFPERPEGCFAQKVPDTFFRLDPQSPLAQRLVYLIGELIGFPRHLSQHVGGMVMTRGPLCEMAPIENAAMPDRTVIQWDKDDLDELGILKVDCLCLGMLTAIRKCFDLVAQHRNKKEAGRTKNEIELPAAGHQPPVVDSLQARSARTRPLPKAPTTKDTAQLFTLATIPPEDPRVYDMICRADTIGVFQIESRAQMSMLPRLKPRCFYDLVIEVAIVRPGPIQGDMVHPYLRRRAGEEKESYPNDAIREVLHRTKGVPIFQEQAMRLAVVAAGFTPGEADQLRRAMGAWRRPGVIDRFRKKLLDGMLERGLSEKFAEQVFHQIRGFGEYGFPESHAASFALLVYASAWLKCYYPAAFCAALINSQPMGFYAPAQLIRDARDHGVEVQPVDVNYSDWDCTLEENKSQEGEIQSPTSETRNCQSLRLGLRMISGFSQLHAEAIQQARGEGGAFRSLVDFTRRTRSNRAVVTRLAEADAFGSLQIDRRTALWHALGEEKKASGPTLFDNLAAEDDFVDNLPEMAAEEQVVADYRTTGLSLKAHPILFHRQELDQLRVTPAEKLVSISNNRYVRVAGIVLLRQRPSTAKGITFVTLEDETGTINLVVHQNMWQRYYTIARRSPAWIAHGKLECKDSVVHVIVTRLEDMSDRLRDLGTKSRDFR